MTAFRSLLLAAILSLAGLAGAQDPIAPQGSGRPFDPYLVSSLGNLLWISQNPSSWSGLFEQTADIDARATANLDQGRGFAPIGTQRIPFKGTFRGHGHAIRGLTISRPDSANRGLFGWVGADARLDSIYILQASVFGLSSSGILAGTLEGGTAFGCRATGKVLTIDGRAGGLVGFNLRGHLQRCRGDVAVYGDGAAIGGLAGSNSGEVDESHASGNVEGFGECGGLVGDNTGLILSSSAMGAAFGRGGIGGLVGSNQGSIRYSQATGSATIHSPPGMTPGSGAGGLVGSNEAEILYCHASGAVEAGYSGGGLVGWNSGRIERSYATGNVVVQENSAGGLVGSTYGDRIFIPSGNPNWAGFGEIRHCYATGTVQAKLWAGGLAGFNSRSAVERSYAIGAVSGGSEVGGLFGNLDLDTIAARPMVVGSYWDIERTGQRLGYGRGRVHVFGAEGRTTAQMRARATFVGWDFDTIWSIDEGFSSPLLHIRSKPQRIDFEPLGLALLSDSFAVARAWASSGLSIALSTSDPSIAVVEGNRIRLVAPGMATITARQEGDSTYLPAAPVSQMLRVASFPFAGHGTAEAPFQIATLEDLRQLSGDTSIWRAHFVQVADIDATPTASWDSGRGFLPIGGRGRGGWFNGSYDGQGHAIKGLTIHRDTAHQLALFGGIEYAARIDSLRLVDVSIRGKAVCGGLVGTMNGGWIRAAHVSGSVECLITAGGLVGSNIDDGRIVSSSASVAVRGDHLLGGLLGQSFGPVRRSWATGAVVGHWNAGGLVGVNGDTIVDCYARGAVTGDSAIGGLVGQASTFSRIVSSYATGRVEGDTATAGLIGYDNGGSVASSYWDIDATGQIRGRGSYTSDDSIFLAVGLTTAEMKARSTYAGWDFSQVWSIEEGVDYPSLRGAADIPSSGRGPNRQSQHLSRGSYALEVFDLRGRLVWQGDALWNGTRWELPRLGAGAWVLRARTERGIVAQRVATFH